MAETQDREQIMLLLSITERGRGAGLIGYLNARGIRTHIQTSGLGTAPSEMMDFLGLGSSDKDILFSLGVRSAMKQLAKELSNNLNAVSRGKGIMMMFSLSAVSRLMAAITLRQAGEVPVTEGNDMMKSEYQHSLIFIVVNQGYTEQVMQTARKAGATGGTVIRARLSGTESPELFHGMALQGEREVVTILAPESIRDQILEDVNREFGLNSKAQGIIGALPVERAFKI